MAALALICCATACWRQHEPRGKSEKEEPKWCSESAREPIFKRSVQMTMIAFAFLQHLRMRERGEKRASIRRAATTADLARRSAQDPRMVPFRAHLLPSLRRSAWREATNQSAQVVLVVRVRNSVAEAGNAGKDMVGVLGPRERLWVGIVALM